MMLHATKNYCAPFKVLDFSVHVNEFAETSKKHGINKIGWDSGDETSRATVRVEALIDDGTDLAVRKLVAADGNGPVDAVASALKKALEKFFPILSDVDLVDYRVVILDNESATKAVSRVLITFASTKSHKTWSTVSVSTNTISASVNALVDGFEYAILEEEVRVVLFAGSPNRSSFSIILTLFCSPLAAGEELPL